MVLDPQAQMATMGGAGLSKSPDSKASENEKPQKKVETKEQTPEMLLQALVLDFADKCAAGNQFFADKEGDALGMAQTIRPFLDEVKEGLASLSSQDRQRYDRLEDVLGQIEKEIEEAEAVVAAEASYQVVRRGMLDIFEVSEALRDALYCAHYS